MIPQRMARVALITLGLLLTVTGLLPLASWILDPARAGVPGAATAGLVTAIWPSAVGGTLVVLVVAWIGSRVEPGRGTVAAWAARLADRPGPRRLRWTIGCAALAAVGAMGTHHLVLRGHPTLLDEMVQLADARVFPGALELPVDPAFRVLQHGRVVGTGTGADVEGWVSMYPPGHTAVLRARLALGHLPIALLWAGAVAAAVSLFFLLLPAPAAAGAGVLLALSPFGWLVGGSTMSHVTAAFGVAVAVLAGVSSAGARGVRASMGWAALVGAAAGVAVTARPLTGLALAVVLPATLWIGRAARDGWLAGARGFAGRGLAATLAGLPFVYLLTRVQATRFGEPFLTGYEATFGPAVRPGFRIDAWGNAYDLPTALGASSADLFLMGVTALETPMPLGALIGLGLLALAVGATRPSESEEHPQSERDRPDGYRPLFLFGGWIVVALLANGTYWHHGFHFGPRMMFETLPAWIGLGVWVAWRLFERGARARGAVAAACAAMLLGAVGFGIPTRLSTARVSDQLAAQLEIAPPPADADIVFLHGSSSRRTVAKLQGLGMRADSIEAAIRRNDLCDVTAWANSHRAGRPTDAPSLDFERRPGSPDGIVLVETAPGVTARFRAGAGGAAEVDQECLDAVVRPDAAGTLELDPLLWRLEDPEFTGGRVLWVRDLGPADNRALLMAYPDRAAYVVTPNADGHAVYEPYEEGMSRIWGAAPD